MGFYDIGLLHILGNTTNAVTAAWREMLDAGMYANFPGFLMADTGARQNTNIFRVPPGGGALVKTGGVPINQAIMPLPYKEPGAPMMQLVQNVVETGQRVGGTAELAVGEGRADAPVGTTLALIDQATKIMNSVHKRLHAAQAEEFQLLVRCFREHPESFYMKCRRPSLAWDEATFIAALDDCELIPQADPNTASHTQRIMKVMALKQLQQGNPSMYNAQAIDLAAMKAMGWSNPEQFLAPPEQQNQMPPEMIKAMEELKILQKEADAKEAVAQASIADSQSEAQARMIDAQTRRMLAEAKVEETQLKAKGQQDPAKEIEAQAKMMDAQNRRDKLNLEAQQLGVESDHKEADRLIDSHHRNEDRRSREDQFLANLLRDMNKGAPNV
jgi:hypothetical protein